MIEGYETEQERARREKQEEAAHEAEIHRRVEADAAAARARMPGAVAELRKFPHDCVVEVVGMSLWAFGNERVKQRVAAWYLGAIGSLVRDDGTTSTVFAAYGADGRFYKSPRGIGGRKEFVTRRGGLNLVQYPDLTVVSAMESYARERTRR